MRKRTWSAIALAFMIAVTAAAADLAITRASWDGEKLSVRGTAPGRTSVAITNAATGAVLKTAKVEGDGRWKAEIEKPARVPCRVGATQGEASVERGVSGAPSNCEGGAARTLASLAIAGPTTVPESSTATFAATAAFSDGTSQVVTATATWTENSTSASIAGGVLTAGAVTSNQAVTVTASYATGGVTRSATRAVTIQNTTTSRTLTGLAIAGPTSVPESSTAAFTASAAFSDGTTQVVTATATWTENSTFASIAGGTLTTTAVTANQAVVIGSSYTSGGVSRSATLPVTIADAAAAALASLAITGPSTVPENGSASYTATATFSNGTTQLVTPTASWGENSGFASIATGVLTTTAVTSNQALMVSSSFTAGGVTRSATLPVTIQDAPAVTGSHAGRFTTYEGTTTCLRCHESEALAFHQSVHYQWKGDSNEADRDARGTPLSSPAGKLGGINDFCIYPDINWLGKLTTTDGRTVDGGCARCHTGLGAKPSPTASQGQLENIDCLLCHSPSYKRMVATSATTGTGFAFVADTANMSVSLLQAAVDIRLPGKDTCLNCHTKAGGGDNFKRGDIEEAHRAATTSLDVHMAPASQGGAGLSCTGCHQAAGHRIAGRGVDMRQRDAGTPTPACATCHTTTPHGDSRLNQHTARVACNVCHVPSFAKTAPTDMRRDWSLEGDLNAVTRLYEPHMLLQANVTPVYKFFNGRSQFYEFGTPGVPQANGRILMAGPLGSINEAGAKITAMKRHEGNQPIDPLTKFLMPLKIGIFFQTGDVATAVTQGAAALGWADNGYQFAETERFMGLYHEVAPKEQAVSCSTCHDNNRLPFADLGYTPLATRNGQPLCSSCHSAKTATFYNLHQKHVTDRRIDCSSCHTFSKAVGG